MLVNLVIVILYLSGAHGACEPEIIKKIFDLWDNNPPVNILSRLRGVLTHLYAPSFMDDDDMEELECAQTELAPDMTSSMHYLQYNDSTRYSPVNSVLEQPGGIYIINKDGPIDHVYTVYFDKDVFGYYMCGDAYDSFISILVRNYDQSNTETAAAIGEAEKKLTKLGKEFLHKFKTDCKSKSWYLNY